ncbi:MAG: thiamine diphosphokinase [Oscillospiraceae bacterium]|jgi:thiamine pyrophosphokinase|nr:thiamine diphosphokinase [Oscillospiraceae bacterium]
MAPVGRAPICFIAGAGDFTDGACPLAGDYIIAADGGYESLVSRGYMPDAVCGDFDSLGYMPDHPNIVARPDVKNETDMDIAVALGRERGCEVFIINGGLGGRLDHVFGNIQIIARIARERGRGFLAGGAMNATAIHGGEARFTAAAGGFVSVFAFGGKASGVTIEGMKYAMSDGDMMPDVPLGVSNEFLSAPSRVSVRGGTLIMMWRGNLYDTAAELCSRSAPAGKEWS